MIQYSQVLGGGMTTLATKRPEPGSVSDSDPEFSHHRIGPGYMTVYKHPRTGTYHLVRQAPQPRLGESDEQRRVRHENYAREVSDADVHLHHLGEFHTREAANEDMYRRNAGFHEHFPRDWSEPAEGGKMSWRPIG